MFIEDHIPTISSHSSRVPYFPYFGPTATVPGFKQMVVEVNNDHIKGKLDRLLPTVAQLFPRRYAEEEIRVPRISQRVPKW